MRSMMSLSTTLLLATCAMVHGAEGDAAAKDFVMVTGFEQPMPRVIHDPGPEYADDTRRFAISSTIARSPAGRLWCGWTSGGRGEGRENYCLVVSSDDEGRTWSPPRIVIDTKDATGGATRTDHCVVWFSPDGRLWVMWNEYPKGLHGAHSSLWAIISSDPDADEPTFSAPRKLADEDNLINLPTVLSDGTWILPTARWRRLGSCPLISRDEGKTFNRGGEVGFGRGYPEYQVVERADGSLVLISRGMAQRASADGGMTWNKSRLKLPPHVGSRFVFIRLRSGSWLLVKHGDAVSVPAEKEYPGTRSKGYKRRHHLTALISKDEGATWIGGLLLDDRLSSYPSGIQAEDGTIYVSYEGHRWGDAEIRMARFTEADVLAGKVVDANSRLRVVVNKATGHSKMRGTKHPPKTP